MSLLRIAFLFFFIQSCSFAGLSQGLKWEKIKEFVVGEVAKLEISLSLDLFDLDIVDGLNVSSSLELEVEPSYIPGKYTRVDRWNLETKIKAGDVIEGISPVYFNVAKDSTINFIRNFPSQLEAGIARPYTINKLPGSSQDILDNLNSGDFISFPAELNLALGAGSNHAFFQSVASGNLEVLMAGTFTVIIYKIDENFTRVKLIASTQNSLRAAGKIKTGFKLVTGVSYIDGKVSDIINVDLGSVSAQRGFGQQYVLDYVYDLRKSSAREALDRVLKPSFKIDPVEMLGKHGGISYFKDKLITDYALTEKLHHSGDKSVWRMFKGFNKYVFHTSEYKVGLVLSKLRGGESTYKNNITVEDHDGRSRHYFFPNHVRYYQETFKLGPYKYKDEFETSYHGLVPLEDKLVGKKYSDVGMKFWREDKKFSRAEWIKVKQSILDLVPKELTDKIDFSAIDEAKSSNFAKVNIQALFKENAFANLKDISLDEVHDKLEKLVKQREILKVTKLGKITTKLTRSFARFFGLTYMGTRSFAKKIHDTLTNPDYTAKKRVMEFVDHSNSGMFRVYGLKLLISLIPKEQWREKVFINIEVLTLKKEPIRFTLGNLTYSKIYKEVLSINRVLHNTSNDVRIILDGDNTH